MANRRGGGAAAVERNKFGSINNHLQHDEHHDDDAGSTTEEGTDQAEEHVSLTGQQQRRRRQNFSLETLTASSSSPSPTFIKVTQLIRRRPLLQQVALCLTVLVVVISVPILIVRKKNDAHTTRPGPKCVYNNNTSQQMRQQMQQQRLDTGIRQHSDAFELALCEMHNSVHATSGRFAAGNGWTSLYTRDTSYSVELSAAIAAPTASTESLKGSTQQTSGFDKTKTWYQDICSHFGGWPHVTDAVVGTQGSWALFLSTGDREFLSWAYNISKTTLDWAERDAMDNGDGKSGLFKGCSSFMESNSGYPPKYFLNGTLVSKTKALSTNVLYYNAYALTAKMGEELGAPGFEVQTLKRKAEQLGTAIRSRLWLEDRGYYSYFEDEDGSPVIQMEGLGEALLLLAPGLETNATRIGSIFDNVYRNKKAGIPCLWPRFKWPIKYDIIPHYRKYRGRPSAYYHNGRVWPFVQGYWALAAAEHGEIEVFGEELTKLTRLATTGNTLAEFYEFDGSFLEFRRRQLWSGAGYLGMIYHGLFGMRLQVDGIAFRPIKPMSIPFSETSSIYNVPYMESLLTIHLTGTGSVIESFKINGIDHENHFLPRSDASSGKQVIEITLR